MFKSDAMKSLASISFVVLTLSLLLFACSEKLSPDDQVRQYMSNAVAAAESRDIFAINKLISDNYSDDSGRDKRALTSMTTGYFLRHKNVHLVTKISEITIPSQEQATVSFYVAMAGTPVTGAKALLDIRADLFQFDFTLIRESDEWLLKKAAWQRAVVDDFIDGS